MTEEELIAKYEADLVTLIPEEEPQVSEPLTAMQVAGGAIVNLPSSLYQLGADVATAITSPVQTAQTVLDLGAGALQEALPESLVQFIGEDERSRELARKVGEMYVERYGSVEQAKKHSQQTQLDF